MGGGVLPPARAPAAQLMYDNDRGTRLTAYIQPMGIDGEEFRYTKQGDIGTIYWAERRLASRSPAGRRMNDRWPWRAAYATRWTFPNRSDPVHPIGEKPECHVSLSSVWIIATSTI